MVDRSYPSYGTPNRELLHRWLQMDPGVDGPFWAVNLMRYHPVARYADGTIGVSGRQADDAYAPLGPLAAVGAQPAFHGDVIRQPLGAPGWDRVGIVRYPSRAAFFAMQQRDDFKQQHVHKEAGMEFTIVMACLPSAHGDATWDGSLVLVVDRGAKPTDPCPDGVAEVVRFDVEGVIVGDDRTFDRVRFVSVADDAALSALVALAATAEETHLMVVEPAIDLLIESITAAPRVADG